MPRNVLVAAADNSEYVKADTALHKPSSLCFAWRTGSDKKYPLWVYVLVVCLCQVVAAPLIKAQQSARLVWTVDLAKAGYPSPSFDSEHAATRRSIFASEDRIVLAYAGPLVKSENGKILEQAFLLSLNTADGSVVASRKQVVTSYQTPSIFATAWNQIILVTGEATLLNADLSETGTSFDMPTGRIQNASPDGAVVAWERWAQGEPGMRILDAHTLQPTGVDLSERTPTTITSRSAASTNAVWTNNKPPYRFGSLTTIKGSKPLFLPNCGKGFAPNFLSEQYLLIVCTDSFEIQNAQEHVLFEQNFHSIRIRFGGVSRNGKAFAIVCGKRDRFDPWSMVSEKVLVYDFDEKKIKAEIPIASPAEGNWTALSPNADLLLTGTSAGLTMYRLP
jgi:hypothetical protein